MGIRHIDVLYIRPLIPDLNNSEINFYWKNLMLDSVYDPKLVRSRVSNSVSIIEIVYLWYNNVHNV